jgi:LPXTG-motif cell wall-anchored protein
VVTPQEVMDEVEVEVHTPPTSSSSTTSSTTTRPHDTTTTDSSVPQQGTPSTTTTVPVTTPTSNGGGLPITGANTLGLVGAALVLLAAGVGFGAYSRRRRAST